jgi:hypothetical protein
MNRIKDESERSLFFFLSPSLSQSLSWDIVPAFGLRLELCH